MIIIIIIIIIIMVSPLHNGGASRLELVVHRVAVVRRVVLGASVSLWLTETIVC